MYVARLEPRPDARITVKAGGAETRMDAPIRIDVSAYKPEPHKNKYGKDYKPPPADEDERY